MGDAVLCLGEGRFTGRVGSELDDRLQVNVVTEPSVSAATPRLETDAIDCVVTAGSLPDEGAIDAVTEVRDTADVPVVVAPDEGTEQLAVRAMRTERVTYVPSTADDRLERLAEHVEERVDSTLTPQEADVRVRSFKRAVEQAGHSIYITDTDGTIRYVNPAFEEVTGYTASEAIGRTPRILKSGEHDAAFYDGLWDTITSGEVWQSEIINRRTDGDRYVVNQTIAPIVVDGDIERFVAVNADITDRIEWEERLETLHDATRRWLDTSSETGVSERACEQLDDLFDVTSVCIYCYDDSEEALVPRASTPESHDPEPLSSANERLWSAFEAGETRHVEQPPGTLDAESELLLPAGEYGLARLTADDPAAFDAPDIAIGRVFISNLEAVLDRLTNYRALERQNERLDEFTAVVSHDLQNPLSVAMGYLELMDDRVDDDNIGKVQESLERMDEIITDLLWLATEGKRVGEQQSVSLRNRAEQAWPLVETGSATLAVDGDLQFDADGERLHQLFENLFANAVDHGGADVTVSVGPLPNGSGFYIADDGDGIPPEKREGIFDSGYTTSDDGTGFGLTIVERIADGHSWSVDVQESADGGARFAVQL